VGWISTAVGSAAGRSKVVTVSQPLKITSPLTIQMIDFIRVCIYTPRSPHHHLYDTFNRRQNNDKPFGIKYKSKQASMQKITDNVYGILSRFGYVNQYLIVNGDVLAVVDMMLGAADVDRLETELAAQGWTLEQVRHVLITHAHQDHIGGLAEFQRRSNARTYAHRIDAQVIRGEAERTFANPDELGWFHRIVYRGLSRSAPSALARVDVDLGDGDALNHIMDSLQVVHLPGHSHGQVGYYLANQNLLIGGDVMICLFGSLRMPFRVASPDWDAAKQSIRRVQALEIDILCLGHGKPVFKARSKIEGFVQRLAI